MRGDDAVAHACEYDQQRHLVEFVGTLVRSIWDANRMMRDGSVAPLNGRALMKRLLRVRCERDEVRDANSHFWEVVWIQKLKMNFDDEFCDAFTTQER